MKSYILALLVVLPVIVSAQLRPPKYCRTDEDCSEDECCVGFVFTAHCRKRLCEGQFCFQDANVNNKVHFFRCPCQNDLECIPDETKYRSAMEIHFIRSTCRSPITTVTDEVTKVTDGITDEETEIVTDEVRDLVTEEEEIDLVTEEEIDLVTDEEADLVTSEEST